MFGPFSHEYSFQAQSYMSKTFPYVYLTKIILGRSTNVGSCYFYKQVEKTLIRLLLQELPDLGSALFGSHMSL